MTVGASCFDYTFQSPACGLCNCDMKSSIDLSQYGPSAVFHALWSSPELIMAFCYEDTEPCGSLVIVNLLITSVVLRTCNCLQIKHLLYKCKHPAGTTFTFTPTQMYLKIKNTQALYIRRVYFKDLGYMEMRCIPMQI